MTNHARSFACSTLFLIVLACAPSVSAAPLDAAALDRASDLAYRRVVEPLIAAKRLNADQTITVRVRRAANRIVAAAATIDPLARTYHWAVNTVPESTPDVLVYPGGRLLVHEGLVRQTGFADEEIAAILGFALAPSLLGHDQARLAEAARIDRASADPNQTVVAIANVLGKSSRPSRYRPEEIKEADRVAIELLARSAYDPRAAASAWRRLANLRTGIAQVAPVNEERLADIDAAARAAVPLYEDARKQAAANTPPPPPRGSQRPGPVLR